jgi:hypothetical protein
MMNQEKIFFLYLSKYSIYILKEIVVTVHTPSLTPKFIIMGQLHSPDSICILICVQALGSTNKVLQEALPSQFGLNWFNILL